MSRTAAHVFAAAIVLGVALATLIDPHGTAEKLSVVVLAAFGAVVYVAAFGIAADE
jgi:hypothetical protein